MIGPKEFVPAPDVVFNYATNNIQNGADAFGLYIGDVSK